MIRFDGAGRSFGHRTVLHGIDLTLEHGDRVVLQGPNGSGKTTLLALAAGLLRPTSGTVTIDGRPATHPEARRGLGVVLQDAPVYAELSPAEHMQWWTRMAGGDPGDWLRGAGLADMADRPAAVLSRGQRQRLAICMAMAAKPHLLLLDEPTTALDADGRQWLHDVLAESEAAVLAATHEAMPGTVRRLTQGRLE